jgi:hypothetical protein
MPRASLQGAFGASEPVANNLSVEGRAENRRVEFIRGVRSHVVAAWAYVGASSVSEAEANQIGCSPLADWKGADLSGLVSVPGYEQPGAWSFGSGGEDRSPLKSDVAALPGRMTHISRQELPHDVQCLTKVAPVSK